jgi:uncharacterized protein YneF (UPF0154 family)
MSNPELLAYVENHHLLLIILVLLAFGVIAAWVGRRQGAEQIADLERRNDALLKILERATGLSADDL